MSAVLDAREARARELRRAHEAPAGVASPSLSELLLEVERLESVLSERKVSSEVCSGAKGLDEQVKLRAQPYCCGFAPGHR